METYRQPRNTTEARSALSLRRGTGEHRTVVWHYFKTPRRANLARGEFSINVKDGNQLDLNVYSGIPFLTVESGHVNVKFMSDWGNSLTIMPGTSARVEVPYGDTKVTIHNEGGDLELIAPEKNRVFVSDVRIPLTKRVF